MKKFEIIINYSWGDEESPIEIEKECKEDAFEYMFELATKELKTCLQEQGYEEPYNLKIYPDENKIILWYGYDCEECYYELIEIN